MEFCESLAECPERGTLREDLRPGLRTMHYRCGVVIAYAILGGAVHILGIYYGGQDYRSLLVD